jgi:hypothetical protein
MMIDELGPVAFVFFEEFARMEFALKITEYFKGKGSGEDHLAQADWIMFAKTAEIQRLFSERATPHIRAAIKLFEENPPRVQVVTVDDKLQWRERHVKNGTVAEQVVEMVKRVRNNLFHGGKFDRQELPPLNNRTYLTAGLVILREMRRAHLRVHEAYEVNLKEVPKVGEDLV